MSNTDSITKTANQVAWEERNLRPHTLSNAVFLAKLRAHASSDKFYAGVLSFYDKKGYVTQRQFNAVVNQLM